MTVESEPGGTRPAGQVQLLEGSTVLGTASPNAFGVVFFQIHGLQLKNGKTASHQIKAKYLGDANTNGSTTPTAYVQVVNP